MLEGIYITSIFKIFFDVETSFSTHPFLGHQVFTTYIGTEWVGTIILLVNCHFFTLFIGDQEYDQKPVKLVFITGFCGVQFGIPYTQHKRGSSPLASNTMNHVPC